MKYDFDTLYDHNFKAIKYLENEIELHKRLIQKLLVLDIIERLSEIGRKLA